MSENTYAALDLGSNSFHLLIARADSDGIRVVDKIKHMVRLGEGLDDDNRIDEAAWARGIAALTQMGQRLADIPEDHCRAVGTNTLRVAVNGDAFLAAGEAALTEKWAHIREARAVVNAAIEPLRADKTVGSSLQAEVVLTAPEPQYGYLKALGSELRFAMLVSKIELQKGDELTAEVRPSTEAKCERCWHYVDSVGSVAAHPTLCARCAENVDGKGETRDYA